MAVNINSVYTTVLYILNKEQRGYITPAEFNSLAVQVQDEIFQAYFPDGNQLNRKNQTNSDNDTEFFNMFKDIAYKLYPFESDQPFIFVGANGFQYSGNRELFKLGDIMSTYTSTAPNVESVTQLTSKKDYAKITRSKLTKPSNSYPICYTSGAYDPATLESPSLLIKVFPEPDSLTVNCIVAPLPPSWRFTVGVLGQYIYSEPLSTNFELDISEQTPLIMGILKYCGIIIRDPEIVQAASQSAQKAEINEKS